jgi:hypothetical protein
MSNRILRRAEAADDRRASKRLPIERDVRYKLLGGKKSVKPVGLGKTVNMSSGGVLFTTESPLLEGGRVELAVSWPAQLNQTLQLKFVALGYLVRSDETHAAISIERYEFKTCGSGGL